MHRRCDSFQALVRLCAATAACFQNVVISPTVKTTRHVNLTPYAHSVRLVRCTFPMRLRGNDLDGRTDMERIIKDAAQDITNDLYMHIECGLTLDADPTKMD